MVRVRQASASDVERLADLLGHLGYPSTTNRVVRSLQEATRDRGGVLVAEENDQVIGFASYHFVYFFEDAAHRCRVTAIAVDHAARRAGTGRALLAEVEKLALAAGCTAIEATSAHRQDREAAHIFYQALGFTDGNTKSSFFTKPLLGLQE